MTEAEYEVMIIGALKYNDIRADPIKSKNNNYVPDLVFSGKWTTGLIEVKMNPDSVGLGAIDHWTRGQQDFLERHGRLGSGHSYLWVWSPGVQAVFHWESFPLLREGSWSDCLLLASYKSRFLADLAADFASGAGPARSAHTRTRGGG